VRGPGGEAPPPAQPVAAVDGPGPAGRRVGRRHPGPGVGAPHLLLRGEREQGQLPGVHAEDRGDPAGRPARAGDQPDGGQEGQRVGLEPAEPGGLEQPEETGLGERLDRLGGYDPGVLGVLGPLAQRRQQVAHAGDHRVLAHRDLRSRRRAR
jgi:hypothetical protein